MQVILQPSFDGDSLNYEVLTEGVERVATVPGVTCEIGLRRGGGTKFILDALAATKQDKVHIAIDPYGNIEYADSDTVVTRHDYTNAMRDECLINLYLHCLQQKQNVVFFNLEDTEFFARYADGVPVYADVKRIETQYAFVHFDGPHSVGALKVEIEFFHARTPTGAVFVFDDVASYDHPNIHTYLTGMGWDVYRTTARKWAYVKR